MNQTDRTARIFSRLFYATGVFAILGALVTWGAGPLTHQTDLLTALVPWADLLITGPLSMLAGAAIGRRKAWGMLVGLMVCGIYLFGSALVYISLVWKGAPYPFELALPPLLGIGIGLGYPLWVWRVYFSRGKMAGQINLQGAVQRLRLEQALGR